MSCFRSHEAKRAGTVFLIVFSLAMALQVVHPTEYYDNLHFDYNSVSASHAILHAERAADTPNKCNLNLNSHPGVPYYLTMGIARTLMGNGPARTPVERIVYFFDNINVFWRFQAVLAGVIAAFGGALLSLYCANAPLLFTVCLFAIPLAYMSEHYSLAYIYFAANETFAMPAAAIFFLLSRRILSAGTRMPGQRFLLTALGAAAGFGYMIKLPYAAFFLSGFAVMALCHRDDRYGMRGWLRDGAAYLLGFMLVLASFAFSFGTCTLLNLLEYHYNVLAHKGFAGGGDSGVVDMAIAGTNMGRLTRYVAAIWPIGALVALVPLWLLVVSRRRRACRQACHVRQIAVLCITACLFTIAVLKHWSYHYALILPIVLCFLAYELIIPACEPGIKTMGVSCVLALCVVLSVFPSYRLFSARIHQIHAARAAKESFVNDIHNLPVRENEVIYYMWSSHVLPVFSIHHPLISTYLDDDAIAYEAFRSLVPRQHIVAKLAYDREKHAAVIRYIVVGSRRLEEAQPGSPITPWDNPAPRMCREENDRIVLRQGDISVLEKAVPIKAP